ncbi:hypothetical protein D3C72_2570690 [compost metagenome]
MFSGSVRNSSMLSSPSDSSANTPAGSDVCACSFSTANALKLANAPATAANATYCSSGSVS